MSHEKFRQLVTSDNFHKRVIVITIAKFLAEFIRVNPTAKGFWLVFYQFMNLDHDYFVKGTGSYHDAYMTLTYQAHMMCRIRGVEGFDDIFTNKIFSYIMLYAVEVGIPLPEEVFVHAANRTLIV